MYANTVQTDLVRVLVVQMRNVCARGVLVECISCSFPTFFFVLFLCHVSSK